MHSTTLFIAISFIITALILYTIGVWSERFQRKLKWWHTAFFWAGFASDTIGTTAMSILSGTMFALTFHGITGNIAIFLMLFHAIWATVVLVRKNEKMILHFHTFSIFVWVIWLIPMISGMVFGATH
ncbi:MAG: HsmA family protein [Bacteroidetes bacterium]|nr:HsmA family protein [Bacteroidota bacterium]